MLARDDMLELTRRMTVQRTSMDRIAGAYLDAEGFVDGTFNVHFLNLDAKERDEKLKVAKAIPFGQPGVQLKEYYYPKQTQKQGSIWQMLNALLECGLKNDALLDVFYEMVGEHYKSDHDYAIYVFHDRYDIPAKGSDKKWQWESEEMFEYLICAICPLEGDYTPGKPECGFLYPVFENRSARENYLAVYRKENGDHPELTDKILQCVKS